jgi:hypothetical protein
MANPAMKNFAVLSLTLVSTLSMSFPVLSQELVAIEGTYQLQKWRHDLGRPALYTYAESSTQSGKCLAKFTFSSNGSGSFTNSNCKDWPFQWVSKGQGSHEWITGVKDCEKLELRYAAGGNNDLVCVDKAGIARTGSDRFGQPLAYTKTEIENSGG